MIEKNKEFKRVKLTHPIGYLLKPFTEEELMSTLEIALFTHENKNINRLPILEILNKKIITPLSMESMIFSMEYSKAIQIKR